MIFQKSERIPEARFLDGDHKLVTSYGVAFRINVFGLMIMELDVVKPVQRPQKEWMLQFGFTQGF